MRSIKVLDYVNKFAKCVFRPTPQIAWECHILFQVAEALYKVAMLENSGILYSLWSKKLAMSDFLAFFGHFSPEVKVLLPLIDFRNPNLTIF